VPQTDAVPARPRACATPACDRPPEQGTRSRYCTQCAARRKTEANRRNQRNRRARAAVAAAGNQTLAAAGRATRTPGLVLNGQAVVELKAVLFDLRTAHRLLAERQGVDDPWLGELDELRDRVKAVCEAMDRLLPLTRLSP